jgi:hypothetical protein
MHERLFLVYYRVGHMGSLKTGKAITVGIGWKSLRASLIRVRFKLLHIHANGTKNVACGRAWGSRTT